MENSNEIWQTSVNGQVYETSFDGLIEWINEGSLLPQDMVRKGNLRWIEAGKVPNLHRFFNAKQLELSNQVRTSTTFQQSAPFTQVQNFNVSQPPPPPFQTPNHFQTPPPPNFYQELNPETEQKFCVIHTDANAKFHCETCGNYFCKACPQNSSCPMCGALCQTLDVPVFRPPVPYQPMSQSINPYQEVVDDPDVRKASNWIFWKAGLTIVNGIIGLTGTILQFSFGMAFPMFLHGFLLGLTGRGEMVDKGNIGASPFVASIFIFSLFSAGLMFLLGSQARQAKKWAFVLGLIIFAFDGLLCIVTLSLLGSIIHVAAIVALSKGFKGCRSR